MRFISRMALLTLSSGSMFASALQAQSTRNVSAEAGALEEIVVTAEHRANNIQNTATSISVRSGESLQQEGKFSIAQILEDIPGVITGGAGQDPANSDSAGLNITIRGVQNNANTVATAAAPSATTATYTDGIYEGIGGAYDLERVEVLRGPQGTLYGRSATSGVVAMHTRNPTFDGAAATASAELGNHALQHYSAAVNAPLNRSLALRVAADEYQRDGFDSGAAGASEKTSGRIKLLYQPSENLSVLLGAAFEENTLHTGGKLGFLASGPDNVSYVDVAQFKTRNSHRQYWTTMNWNTGPATLTYQGAYRQWLQGHADAHSIYFNFPNATDSSGARRDTEQSRIGPLDQFITHELRLASNNDSALKWIVGAVSYNNLLHRFDRIDLLAGGGNAVAGETRKKVQDWGGFGELTYALTNAWRVTAGARYDRTYVQTLAYQVTSLPAVTGLPPFVFADPYPARSVNADEGTQRFHNKTYKLRTEYDLAPHHLVYALASSGFLPGDVQVAGGRDPTNPASQAAVPVAFKFEGATLNALEAGTKNRFLDEALQINASVYRYRYDGYQQIINTIPGNPASAILFSVPVVMKGAELELLYQATPDDRIGLNYSQTDARYRDKPAEFAANVMQQRVTGVIPQTITVSYDHVLRLPGSATLTLHADARRLGSHDLVGISTAQQAAGYSAYSHVDSQTISDVSASFNTAGGKYSLTGYVRNAGDNRYKTSVIFNGDPSNPAALGNTAATQYDPRTYGLMVSVAFKSGAP